VSPGLNLTGHCGSREVRERPPYTIGYFARICPEKGFHRLVEAFRILRQTPGAPKCRLRVSGWLGENHRPYFDQHMRRLRDAGLSADVEHVDSPSHAEKVAFLQTLDVMSVPTTYREPKGIYIMEALANGVPVVQPRHGAFPELIEAMGGGILVEPNDPAALAIGLQFLLKHVELRRRAIEQGGKIVRTRFTAQTMAEETAAVLARYHQRRVATSIPEAVPT
jgi:glycosyltransferase involved in cell wall biosynthesis